MREPNDGYQYSPADCDVEDQARLVKFRARRSEWLDALSGNDRHSIWNQFYEMTWNDAVYRMILEARRLAPRRRKHGVAINGTVSGLLDIGFATTQTLAIRRILDRTQGTVSLRRVLAEVTESRRLITRETYVSHDGLPFDSQSVERTWLIEAARRGTGASRMPSGGPTDWSSSMVAHSAFDRLARVRRTRRQRGDTIAAGHLRAAAAELDACKSIVTFVDHFVAHAGSVQRRAGLAPEEAAVTLARLEECYKRIYIVANFLTGAVLHGHGSATPLPIPQFNVLEGLDRPWVCSEDMDRLHDAWRRRERRLQRWRATTWPAGKPRPTAKRRNGSQAPRSADRAGTSR